MSEKKRLTTAINELDELLSAIPWNYPPEPKNAVESSKTRKDGNDLYVHEKHDDKMHLDILKLYTRSVAFAPMDSEELGLAYANRSALLAHFKKYVDSIEDLERAIRFAVTDFQIVKLMCRKVEYQAALGLEEAEFTCEEAKLLLEDIEVSDEEKKKLVVKLVKAIIKLKKGEYEMPEDRPKFDLPNIEKFQSQLSPECPSASSAITITHNSQQYNYGRHLTATRDINSGEILYIGEPYVGCPIDVYLNCSHCLRFVWCPLPCDNCAHAVYCDDRCRTMAKRLYHDVECKILEWIWKGSERMNAARTMSVRLVIMAVREAGGLSKLKEKFDEINACQDYRNRGFNDTHFGNNYQSAYSLRTNLAKRLHSDKLSISKASAVLLHLLAKHTSFFRKYFDSDKKALLRSEDAMFIGKLLSHYQHLILLNAITVKDLYKVLSTDWNWSPLAEADSSALYITPYLCLLNHSCFPNVKRCEMNDRRTVLYAIRPIAKGEQIFCSYGPTFSDTTKNKRQEILSQSFHFQCKCIACEENWPMFTILLQKKLTYNTRQRDIMEATNRTQLKSDNLIESLRSTKNLNFNPNDITDLIHAIHMTMRHCQLPNWRIASLTTTLSTIINCIYSYIIEIPEQC